MTKLQWPQGFAPMLLSLVVLAKLHGCAFCWASLLICGSVCLFFLSIMACLPIFVFTWSIFLYFSLVYIYFSLHSVSIYTHFLSIIRAEGYSMKLQHLHSTTQIQLISSMGLNTTCDNSICQCFVLVAASLTCLNAPDVWTPLSSHIPNSCSVWVAWEQFPNLWPAEHSK